MREADMNYGLAEGLSCCAVGRQIVILDLARDRYFMISGACDQAFKRFLQGPAFVDEDDIGLLRARNLLSANGASPSLCSARRPIRSALPTGNRTAAPNTVRAAIAYLRASWALKNRGLAATVARYRAMPSTLDHSGEESRRRATVMAFESLRLFFDSTDRCLPLSFAMAIELKRLRCRCDVVFGITVEPFRAHCWTQHQDQVLNDRLDHVLGFQPILVL